LWRPCYAESETEGDGGGEVKVWGLHLGWDKKDGLMQRTWLMGAFRLGWYLLLELE
jgi:hypothetical protein